MSFEAMTWAVKKRLPTNQKMVLLMLANRTNGDTGRCDPSHQRLAEDCGMSVSTVKRAIAQLEEAGLLEVETRTLHGVNLPNQYLLNLDRVGSERTDPRSQGTQGVGSHRPTKQELLNQEVKQLPHTPKSDEQDQEQETAFEQFWKLYPNKKSKKDARRAWEKLKPNAELRLTLMTALGNHRVSRDWTKDDGQYVPMASRWLNGEKWHDELKPAGGSRPRSFNDLPQHTPDMYEESHDGRANF